MGGGQGRAIADGRVMPAGRMLTRLARWSASTAGLVVTSVLMIGAGATWIWTTASQATSDETDSQAYTSIVIRDGDAAEITLTTIAERMPGSVDTTGETSVPVADGAIVDMPQSVVLYTVNLRTHAVSSRSLPTPRPAEQQQHRLDVMQLHELLSDTPFYDDGRDAVATGGSSVGAASQGPRTDR